MGDYSGVFYAIVICPCPLTLGFYPENSARVEQAGRIVIILICR